MTFQLHLYNTRINTFYLHNMNTHKNKTKKLVKSVQVPANLHHDTNLHDS